MLWLVAVLHTLWRPNSGGAEPQQCGGRAATVCWGRGRAGSKRLTELLVDCCGRAGSKREVVSGRAGSKRLTELLVDCCGRAGSYRDVSGRAGSKRLVEVVVCEL